MFCLEDGTALVQPTVPAVDPNATLVMPTARVTSPGANAAGAPTLIAQNNRPLMPAGLVAAPPRRASPLPWILGLGVLVLLGISGIVIAFVVMSTRPVNPGAGGAVEPASPSPDISPELEAQPNAPRPTSYPGQSPTASTSPIRTPPGTVVGQPSRSQDTDEPPPPPATKPTPPRAPISGGVLNGKAIRLVQPAYPPIARAAHASGTVVVQVLIDEDGNVASAHAVSGHPLLQTAAVAAARASKFSPTKLSGQPVKVMGIVQYNFVAQ